MDKVKYLKRRAEAQARYRKTFKGKAANKKYWSGKAGHATKQRFITKWRARNPLKFKVHNKVARAIRVGKLKRGTCEVCKSQKVVGHHDDYSKPLDVRWFCRKHHIEIHCLPRYEEATARR